MREAEGRERNYMNYGKESSGKLRPSIEFNPGVDRLNNDIRGGSRLNSTWSKGSPDPGVSAKTIFLAACTNESPLPVMQI